MNEATNEALTAWTMLSLEPLVACVIAWLVFQVAWNGIRGRG